MAGFAVVMGWTIPQLSRDCVAALSNSANVHQRGLRRGLDQQVQITARRIITAKGIAEYPHAAQALTQRNLADSGAVQFEGFGRAHKARFSWFAL